MAIRGEVEVGKSEVHCQESNLNPKVRLSLEAGKKKNEKGNAGEARGRNMFSEGRIVTGLRYP